MTLSPQEAGDAIFLEAVKEAPESGFSGLYLAASVWFLRRQTSGPALKASIPQSGPESTGAVGMVGKQRELSA